MTNPPEMVGVGGVQVPGVVISVISGRFSAKRLKLRPMTNRQKSISFCIMEQVGGTFMMEFKLGCNKCFA
jgi:hypothetical protein